MSISPFLTIYAPDGKPVPGTDELKDSAGNEIVGSYVEEFEHCVYTIMKDYFYALLYGVDFVRRHTSMTIVKQIDKMSVPLMKYLANGTFFPKVELRWYQYNKKIERTEEYFRMTLEHVRLQTIKHIIPDVKDAALERYGHLESIQLVFQKINWLYVKGHLSYTDIWNEAFSELDAKDFSGKSEAVEELVETPVVDTLKIKFTSGKFEEPEDGFEFDKKARIKFTFSANRKPDGRENKVYAKIYAVYNGKTEDLCLTNEGRLVNDDSWTTEFKLKTPEIYEKESTGSPEDMIEYFVEIENDYAEGKFKSESCEVMPDAIEFDFSE